VNKLESLPAPEAVRGLCIFPESDVRGRSKLTGNFDKTGELIGTQKGCIILTFRAAVKMQKFRYFHVTVSEKRCECSSTDFLY
jgi:hypothetical protein